MDWFVVYVLSYVSVCYESINFIIDMCVFQTLDSCKMLKMQTFRITMASSSTGMRFSLNGTNYQNNSIVILEDIGGGDDGLLCITDQPACCQSGSTSGSSLGNWFFPNGTRVPSSGVQWDFHRTRGQSVVRLQRRRGGVEGIYRCEIPDEMNVDQTIYIGVYSEPDAGE